MAQLNQPLQVEDLSPEASPVRPVSQEKQRTGTGRFNAEELACFKRVPTPSRPNRLEQAEDGVRRSRSESIISGKDAIDSQQLVGDSTSSRLPQEDSTARVLDLIYPRNSGFVVDGVMEQSEKRQSVGRRTKKLQSTSSSLSLDASQQAHQRPKMGMAGRFLQFRTRILEKFLTMKNAFDTFTSDNSSALVKELSRKQFKQFLNRYFHGLSAEEQDNIFEFLDQDKNGLISLAEFHTAVEAAAPVRSMEDLRRKLIALGHTSMREVIVRMDGGYEKNSSKRLGFQEFSGALARVGITDEEEHQAIFNLISEANDTNTVSLDELHSSIAAVSPSLLIEDIRDKFIKKFGTLHTAYSKIDLDDNNRLTATEFVRHAVIHLKMSHHEAMKAYAIMDIDGNNWISRVEFLSALRLSEPSLFLEDLRKKVRQRFRSIREAFGHDEEELSHFEPPEPSDTKGEDTKSIGSKANKAFRRGSIDHKDSTAKSASSIHLFLSTVGFSESDTKLLFELVDIDREGKLTSLEFVRGIKLFAPSCVLEDLRLQCLRNHSRCRDAFKRRKNKEAVMDLKTFKQLLQDLKLDNGVNVENVYYLVESRRDGGLALGELFAALHSGAPGVQMPLPPDQRDAKARQQVKWQMAPFHKSAGELRSQMRQKIDGDTEPPRTLPMGIVNDPRSYVSSSSLHQRRLSRSSPDLKRAGPAATDGFLSSVLSNALGGMSALHSTAPPGIGFGMSPLGAAGQLQSLGPSPIDDASRAWGRSPTGGFATPGFRDPLGASPRSPSSPSFPRLGDTLGTPGSGRAAAMDMDLGGQSPARFRGQSPAKLGGQSPGRRQRSPSPQTPLKRRESFAHAPSKQSYKKISNLVRNVIPDQDNKPMLDRLHGYYLNAGQTVANDASLAGEPLSRMKQFQAASGHHAALARSV